MPKRCPSCGYNQIGPFIDNCPICAEPVRNVRSDAGGILQLANLSPVFRWILGGLLIAVLGVVGCCGLGLWRFSAALQEAQKHMEQAQANAEAERQARTVVVAAADLLREFGDDPDAADRKYAGKYLEISGVVERSGRGRYDAPFVILSGSDKNAKLKIECFFVLTGRRDEAQLLRLGKGESITVRGEYDGQVSNVQVRDCVLVPKPD